MSVSLDRKQSEVRFTEEETRPVTEDRTRLVALLLHSKTPFKLSSHSFELTEGREFSLSDPLYRVWFRAPPTTRGP